MMPTSRKQLFLFSCWLFATVASAGECTLCGDSSIPDNALTHNEDGVSCRDLFDSLGQLEDNSAECNSIQLTAFQAGCCGDDYVPKAVCSLCPDGSSFRTEVTIPGSPGRRELTCQDLDTEPSFLDFLIAPGRCSDTFLQRSAGWCQCPGTEIQCHICPDGSSPPDPYLTETVLYGWNCASFEYVIGLFSKAECSQVSTLLEFDAAAFCCPGVSKPPQVCNFCPENTVVRDPEQLVWTEYGELACGEIETSISMIPTEESCKFVLEKFDQSVCCFPPDTSKGFQNNILFYQYLIALVLFVFQNS